MHRVWEAGGVHIRGLSRADFRNSSWQKGNELKHDKWVWCRQFMGKWFFFLARDECHLSFPKPWQYHQNENSACFCLKSILDWGNWAQSVQTKLILAESSYSARCNWITVCGTVFSAKLREWMSMQHPWVSPAAHSCLLSSATSHMDLQGSLPFHIPLFKCTVSTSWHFLAWHKTSSWGKRRHSRTLPPHLPEVAIQTQHTIFKFHIFSFKNASPKTLPRGRNNICIPPGHPGL